VSKETGGAINYPILEESYVLIFDITDRYPKLLTGAASFLKRDTERSEHSTFKLPWDDSSVSPYVYCSSLESSDQ
jgi:hypothetical protein